MQRRQLLAGGSAALRAAYARASTGTGTGSGFAVAL